MRVLTLAMWLIASSAAAQEPVAVSAESARTESVPAPPPPSPEQLKYLDGLKTAGRGVAQLKSGVTSVANAGRDTTKLKLAGRRLGGLCGAARGFMSSGRSKMQANAYADSTQLRARRLATQIDTLVKVAGRCESSAARQTDSTASAVLNGLRAYEAALRDFRGAIGLPNH
ncbi:MAG TPA: hypothetical protein VLV16_09145 [Gemmatimonadales bacterium]|nr:hypothetical protein [Gemmatimonadales bacterium]